MYHVLAIIGARPQFIKLASIHEHFRAHRISLDILHTGQHYDSSMSGVFFKQLGIPTPSKNLNVNGGTHGYQTSKMLKKIEEAVITTKPDMVLVFGDTNSTLAGALAAVKHHVPIAHVEAGMRSFNVLMPEEINRKVTDHISTLHFCVTETAKTNLRREGIISNTHVVGDVMADLLFRSLPKAKRPVGLEGYHLKKGSFYLITIHRAYNTDDIRSLKKLVSILKKLTPQVIFPVHPRTKKILQSCGLWDTILKLKNVIILNPVGYHEVIWLMQNARTILTDSGGMQKEAYLLRVPCITLRSETEWIETVQGGWNTVTGLDLKRINTALQARNPQKKQKKIFGDGDAGELIVNKIYEFLQATRSKYR